MDCQRGRMSIGRDEQATIQERKGIPDHDRLEPWEFSELEAEDDTEDITPDSIYFGICSAQSSGGVTSWMKSKIPRRWRGRCERA